MTSDIFRNHPKGRDALQERKKFQKWLGLYLAGLVCWKVPSVLFAWHMDFLSVFPPPVYWGVVLVGTSFLLGPIILIWMTADHARQIKREVIADINQLVHVLVIEEANIYLLTRMQFAIRAESLLHIVADEILTAKEQKVVWTDVLRRREEEFNKILFISKRCGLIPRYLNLEWFLSVTKKAHDQILSA